MAERIMISFLNMALLLFMSIIIARGVDEVKRKISL
tara:strand:+ start:337 stop:444 length:108 start_codon:yes stop_codon:yes gene_type:complete